MTKKTRAKARRALLTLSLVLVMMVVAVGGTIAWLTDTTQTITNTFTDSEVDIKLAETTKDYKMVPGNTISKDPTVTVEANSEAAWLFVKIEKVNNFDNYMTYNMQDGWTELTGVTLPENTKVYYRQVAASTADQPFTVIKDNTVTVNEGVTNTMMDTAATAKPQLVITAYAVQQANVATAADAWAKVANLTAADQYGLK